MERWACHRRQGWFCCKHSGTTERFILHDRWKKTRLSIGLDYNASSMPIMIQWASYVRWCETMITMSQVASVLYLNPKKMFLLFIIQWNMQRAVGLCFACIRNDVRWSKWEDQIHTTKLDLFWATQSQVHQWHVALQSNMPFMHIIFFRANTVYYKLTNLSFDFIRKQLLLWLSVQLLLPLLLLLCNS